MTRRRYIQDPVTLKLVPAEEYVRPGNRGPMIQGELEPFRSHVDGSVIESRKDLREHNARNNVVSASDMESEVAAKTKARQDFYAGRAYDTETRLAAVKFAYEIHNAGRSAADIKQMTENFRRRS